MAKRKATVTEYTAPGVSVTVHFKKTPAGYIKDVPIKGYISNKTIARAVKAVLMSRPASAKGSSFKIAIPGSKIAKGYKIGIRQPKRGIKTPGCKKVKV